MKVGFTRLLLWLPLSALLIASADGGSYEAIASRVAPQVNLPVTLTLKRTARVSGTAVYLSDVADCRGSESLCQESYGIQIAETPAPSSRTIVTRGKVEAAIAVEWPGAEVTLAGAERSTVVPLVSQIDEVVILDALRAAVDKLELNKSGLKVTVLGIKAYQKIRHIGTLSRIEFPELGGSGSGGGGLVESIKRHLATGVLPLVCRVVIEERNQSANRTYPIRVRFATQRFVPVAVRDLERGDRLSKDSVRHEWQPVRTWRNDYLSDLNRYGRHELKRPLRGGEVLRSVHLRRRPAVTRGSIINLILSEGNLTISTRVRALAPGGVGDRIPVQAIRTRKRNTARVVDRETVALIGM